MGMEKYMGYQAKEPVKRPERLLPEINIAGTLFYVDIAKLEFRQVDNPANRMPLIGAKEEMGFSCFFFDTNTKNIYAGVINKPADIPPHVTTVLLQPLKELDPVGLARQQGLPDNYYDNRRAVKEKAIVFSKETAPKQQPATKKLKGKRL